VRTLGSLLVLAAPFLAAAGFFTEPGLSGLERPYSRPAAYGCFAGMLLHLIGWSAGEANGERKALPDRPVEVNHGT
jgi:hypothetical protein